MAKAVKAVGTAIMIVGAVVATGGMALAMGAGVGLLGSASLATSAVLSVGSFSVSAGALLSVGTLVSSIGGSLAQPKVSSAGGALGWVGDPNGPLHFAAGRIAVGGDLRHKAAYGPNDRMYFSAVTVVSDAGPIDAFESFTANDIAVTFDASGKANSSYYANVMWRRTQLGFQPEGSYLASPSGLQGGASLPNWGASHKLSGKAGFILTLAENSKQSAYKGQYAKPRTIIRGLRVYDWRRDSTYPGGSGPQRLNDPSTWAYSANPILWSVKWLLGLWEGPNGKGAPQVDYQVGGIGTRWENIDVAAFTEAANIADTHGWTCAAWPSTDDDKAQVLDAFLQAGGAYYIERAGKASCIHRAAPRVSVATITAADTAGPIELDTSASYLDRKNAGVATYLSEADGWKMTALPEVSSSQWVTEDGGRKRSVPVTYSYVDKAKQAAELMCLALAHTREGISGRIPLKSYMQGIGPGSAFTITEPEFVLDGLKCLCLETSYDANTGVHTVTFVSETDAKYPYAFGQTPSPPPPPALTPVDPTHVSPPLPGDWTIIPRPPAPGGGQLPGFDLGGIVSNETATAVIVEYGPTATGPWTQAYQGPPTVTTIPIDGLQPGATYYIAVQYQRDQNYSERYVYGPYTAPNLEPSHLNTEPVQDVLDKLTNTATLADQNRQAVEALEEVYGDTASAAQSAAVAAASEAAAAQAKADALIAKAGAESSASAAQTAKSQAETARAGAETAQTSAANSATTATGAASTATSQAGLATTAKNDAQAASSAAVIARNQASSFADAAGISASASQASSVSASTAANSAQNVANRLLPDRMAQLSDFSLTAAGQPDTLPSLVSPANGTVVVVTGEGSVFQTTSSSNIYSKGWRQLEDGRTYGLTVRQRVTVDGPGNFSAIFFHALDSAGASLGQISLSSTTLNVSQGWVQTYAERTTAQIKAAYPGAAYIRSRIQPNRGTANPSGATTQISVLRLEDVTAQTNAAGSASAAAQSASNASASETAAGQSASAASTAKTQAETARGQAQTAATQASSSRDDAAGSAANASASATQAANSRDAAAGSASAASGSASTASTKAGEAGTHAAAALASQVTASTARDEALQALMQQGRTNLVARENVTPGSPVTSPSPSTSGWGFTMTGNGSGVERGIVVGPLKQSTPYSVSFKARRSIGTGASSLSVDLYPDTLPERVFQIDENWTDFKWEGLTSSHPDMTLPNVRLRFFRSPLASGVQFEITDIKLEEGATATAWTPSPKDAPASAQAAATSASSASASETAAGASANSASGSATTATTAAGQAQTYSNQASSSATAAAGSATTASQASGTAVSARDAAIGARNDAQGAAATAIAQASSASASAASAQISADLAASVGTTRPNLLKNGGLEEGSVGMSGSGPLVVSDDPAWGRNAKNTATNSGTHSIVWPAIPVKGGARYTISGDTGYFHTGAGGNSYLDMLFYDANGTPVLDGPQKAINGPHDFSNAKERLQAHAVSVVAPANAVTAVVRAIFTDMNAPTFMGARRVKVEEGDLPATAFTSEASANQIAAQLNITAAVAADAQTRLASVRFDVTGGAGGDPFDVSLKAGPNGSDASITATRVRLRNMVNGQIVDALTVEGGKAKFSGDLSVQSGASGERTVITTNAVRVFDGNNIERVTLGRW